MKRFSRNATGTFFAAVLVTATLHAGTNALASTKDACALVPLPTVQHLIGADGIVAQSIPAQAHNGATASYCTYLSKAYGANLGYFTFPTAAAAQSASTKLAARTGGRGYMLVKGSVIISAFVNDNSSRHSENVSFSKQLGAMMLGGL